MPKVIQVIESETPRGRGIAPHSPFRTVTQYHALDGSYLGECDPCSDPCPGDAVVIDPPLKDKAEVPVIDYRMLLIRYILHIRTTCGHDQINLCSTDIPTVGQLYFTVAEWKALHVLARESKL